LKKNESKKQRENEMTERLGNHIRENLPRWKEVAENTLDFKLGDIEVQPFYKVFDDYADLFCPEPTEQEKKNKRWAKIILMPWVYLVQQIAGAKTGEHTIYYSTSFVNCYLRGPREMTILGLHELGHCFHLANLREKGIEKPTLTVPFAVSEGTADYLMLNFARELEVPNPTCIYKKNLSSNTG